MTEKRYIRTIAGQIYDCKDDKWVTEDWDRLTLEEDDEVVELLNKQDETIQSLKKELFELKKDYLIETADISDKLHLDDDIKELAKELGVKIK